MKAAGSIVGAIAAVCGPMLAALGAAVLLGACASCQSTVRQASLPALAGAKVDGVAFDSTDRRLYLSGMSTGTTPATTTTPSTTITHGVAMVDLSSPTPQFVRTIDVTHTPGALAFASDEDRLFVAMSNGRVGVVDTKSTSTTYLQVIATIAAGTTTARTLDYDPTSHLLLVGTGSDGQVVSINTRNNGIHAVYAVGLPVGQPRYNPADGFVYVTVPSADAIYQIRPGDGKMTRKLVARGCHPSAMAISPSHGVALAGCRGSIGVFDLKTGQSSVTRAVAGAATITYDAPSDRFAVASPHDATDSAIGVFAGDGGFIGSVAATPNSYAAVFDDARGVVYAPSAAGLLSLSPGDCLPPPSWLRFLASVAIFAVPLGAAALFLVLYARRMKPRSARGRPEPSFRELQREDHAFERERMRAFEDSILGPELTPEP